MAPYRILLHDADGDVADEQIHDFRDDDAAVDHTGSINHPHRMQIWQGDRHVADFPPVDSIR